MVRSQFEPIVSHGLPVPTFPEGELLCDWMRSNSRPLILPHSLT